MHTATLDQREFQRALWIAALMHLAIFAALGLVKLKHKTDFPFQIVDIRLGDSTQKKPANAALPHEKQESSSAVHKMAVAEDNIPKAPPIPHAKPDIVKPESKPLVNKIHAWRRTRAADDNFRPVARTLQDYVNKGDPRVFGMGIADLTPETDAEVTRRYTQVLSLWLYKYRDYPEQARKNDITGKALIRLRIDRTGRILFYQLDKTTGHDILDNAIREMVYRASPVPQPPGHFPGGGQLEFLIPIVFTLD